jgi:hypothetical protein
MNGDVTGYLAMPSIRRNPAAIDQRFIEYVLPAHGSCHGRIIDLLGRAAAAALGHGSNPVCIDE